MEHGSAGRVYRKILAIRHLSDTTFVLRFERLGLDFEPGQYLSVGLKNDINMREYSIYSPIAADYLEILVKEVESGYVSPRLKRLKPGDLIYAEGPFGFFTISPEQRRMPLYFIATGTGISPFHCFTGSDPRLNYTLLHGIRDRGEAYEHQWYDANRLVACLSRDPQGLSGEHRTWGGRVTSKLLSMASDGGLSPEGQYYLCGNCDMIYEAYDIITQAGVEANQIFAEVYF